MHSAETAAPTASRTEAELLARGWLSVSRPGLISSAGPFFALCEYFHHQFAALARRRGAEPHQYPCMLSRGVLERLEYFSSFPGVATPAGEDHVLSPAVCYHAYQLLENRAIRQSPLRITAEGRCCRFEGDRLTRSPERLWEFTMREIIFFGSSAEVERERRALMRSVVALLPRMQMIGATAAANDPFFAAENRGKLLLQRFKDLKHELRAPAGGNDLAIASFNHHEEFFTSRMNITLPEGARAASGCVAFGIERWAYAFVCQNGFDPDRWPEPIRRFVNRHAAG